MEFDIFDGSTSDVWDFDVNFIGDCNSIGTVDLIGTYGQCNFVGESGVYNFMEGLPIDKEEPDNTIL